MGENMKNKFDLIFEETIMRFQSNGLLEGDYARLIKKWAQNPKIKDKAQSYLDRLDYMVRSGLPIKVGAIKAERTETTNGVVGSPDAPVGHWVDIVTEAAPGLWCNVITVPIEILERVEPTGNNFSPGISPNIIKQDPTTLKPNEVRQADPNRNLPSANSKI